MKSKTVPVVLIIALVAVSFVIGKEYGQTQGHFTDDPRLIGDTDKPNYLYKDVDFDLYWDVVDVVTEKYIDADEVLDTELFYGSLGGMVASLGDPYSVFLTPKVTEDFTEELSGNFQGIGAEIGIKKEVLTIIAPLPDSPAEKAGLQPGDYILEVDDVSTQDMALDEAVNRIRGEGGTEVILTVLTPGDDESRDVSIVRDVINIVSVRWENIDNHTAYIKVSYFNQDTEVQFKEVVREVIEMQPDNIILDVRNNPGGFLEIAVGIASYWVDDDAIVLERFSDGREVEYKSRGRAIFEDIPTVVLVNGGSASASEIVAGALQDYGKATVIGQTTFGKGSVQDLIELKDGSSVKITIAKWLTPNGRTIEQEGIEPNYNIELTREDYDNDLDPQRDAAVSFLLGTFDIENYESETE
ncbi:MAG: S41 family peptidase [Patescibacteria group bacterium]